MNYQQIPQGNYPAPGYGTIYPPPPVYPSAPPQPPPPLPLSRIPSTTTTVSPLRSSPSRWWFCLYLLFTRLFSCPLLLLCIRGMLLLREQAIVSAHGNTIRFMRMYSYNIPSTALFYF